MFSETPWILIAIVGILILLLVSDFIIARNRQISGTGVFPAVHKKAFMFQFTTGLLCSLFGAFLMFNGE